MLKIFRFRTTGVRQSALLRNSGVALLKSALGFALAFLVVLPVARAAEYKEMTIRAATSGPDGSHQAFAIDTFKKLVEDGSGGRIKVQTFYGGAMGDEQANVRQLRSQEIQLAVVAVGNLTPFASQATLFSMPYLFPEMDSAYKVFDDKVFSGRMAERIAQQSGTRPLSWLVGGYRYITNSVHPIRKLEDLQGLKIRVPPVAVQLEAFKSWGVEPHPLAWSETFNALQQGVVDGQENPYTVNRDNKFWEVQKYVTELPYMLWVGPMLVSEGWYRRLDEQTRSLVDKAAREAAHAEWQFAEEQTRLARQQCIDHGMEVATLSDGAEWQQRARSIWPGFYDQVGGQVVLDEVLKIISTN